MRDRPNGERSSQSNEGVRGLRRFLLFVLAAILGVAVAAGQSLSQPANQPFTYTEKSPVADTPACPAAGATFVDQSPTGQTQVNGVWTLTIQSSSYGSTPFYSVTVKSGSQANMDVVYSADGRTATLTSTPNVGVVTLAAPIDRGRSPPRRCPDCSGHSCRSPRCWGSRCPRLPRPR